MRIALTSPFGYPQVARGAERYCSELATWLSDRGHDVTWLYTALGSSAAPAEAGGRRQIAVRRPPIGWGPLRCDDLVQAGRALHDALRDQHYEMIQCHHHVDATAVRTTKGHAPYVIWVPGVARRAVVRRRLLHALSVRVSMPGAARIHALSRYAQTALLEELGVQSEVVPPGVDVARYAGPRTAPSHPVVVCTAAADDPRKHVDLLVQAFEQVLRHRPDAELVVANNSGEAAERLRAGLSDAARRQMSVRTGLDFDGIAALYRSATVSVLPSLDEAFGLVMVESLAAGTPVVGTDHGAIPEILDDERVGRLFAPLDVDGLVRSMLDVFELSADHATADRCRAHAQRWAWSTVGPGLEAIYGDLSR